MMMNHNDKFDQERWQFRRQDCHADSSSDDDSRPNSSGELLDRNHKLLTNHIISTGNDETIDAPEFQQDKPVEVVEKEIKLSKKKKKKVVQNEKFKECSPKEEKEDKKRKTNLSSEEIVMWKDLKMFGDSIIDELKVARENMFGKMKEEMSKFVDLRPKLEPKKKNARRSPKKNDKPRPRKGAESRVKPPKRPVGVSKAVEATAKSNELHKGEGSRTPTDMISAGHSDQIVSPSCLTLPSVVLKPNNSSSSIPLSDHIPVGVAMNNSCSGLETGKSMDAQNIYQQFQEIQHISCKSVGQKSGVGLPSPLHQVLESGSNISSLTYSGNSFISNVDPRMNGPTALSRFSNNISGSSVPSKSDEGLLSQLAGTQMASFTRRHTFDQ